MLTQFLSSQSLKHLPLAAETQGWNPCLSTVSALSSIHCHTRVVLEGKLHNILQRSFDLYGRGLRNLRYVSIEFLRTFYALSDLIH